MSIVEVSLTGAFPSTDLAVRDVATGAEWIIGVARWHKLAMT